MVIDARLLTEDDLLRLPDDGYRHEIVEGELRQMPPAGYEHGRCTGRLHGLLSAHVFANHLGDVLAAETGFVMARSSDGRVTVRAADIAFVAAGRIPTETDTSKFLDLPPDLVIETLSPADTAIEVEGKIASWLAAGVRLAVIVNPLARSVTLRKSTQQSLHLSEQDELDLSEIVSGFRCRVSQIFA